MAYPAKRVGAFVCPDWDAKGPSPPCRRITPSNGLQSLALDQPRVGFQWRGLRSIRAAFAGTSEGAGGHCVGPPTLLFQHAWHRTRRACCRSTGLGCGDLRPSLTHGEFWRGRSPFRRPCPGRVLWPLPLFLCRVDGHAVLLHRLRHHPKRAEMGHPCLASEDPNALWVKKDKNIPLKLA